MNVTTDEVTEGDDGALSIAEFCAEYGIGRTAAYQEINSGRLEARKRGSRTIIPRRAARRWLKNLPPLKTSGADGAR